MADKVDDVGYKQYLYGNKNPILEVFNIGGKDNLRTLIFFIDAFWQIHDEIKNNAYAKT